MKLQNSFLITLLFSLTSFLINGQTLLKSGYVLAHNLGYCSDTASLAKLIVTENERLKIVNFGRIETPFSIKSTKTDNSAKSTKAKIGGFLKQMESTNKAYEKKEGALVVSINTLDPETSWAAYQTTPKDIAKVLKVYQQFTLDKSETFCVYPNVYKEGFSYGFNGGCGLKGFSTEKGDKILPINEFYAQYPELNYSKKDKPTVVFKSKGDGLLGTKNSRCMAEEVQFTRYIDSSTAALVPQRYVRKLLKEAVSTPKLANFMSYTSLSADDNRHFGLARSTEGRWGMYQNYSFVPFNKDGDFGDITKISLEYLKDVRYCDFAYNKKGEKTGIVVIFSGFVMIGGKSQRDPKDNNHLLYYFGLDGKLKYNFAFEHGDKDNNRGIQPIIFLSDDKDELTLYNANFQKLMKPILEVVHFDKTSKGNYNEVNQKLDAFFISDFGGNVKFLEDGNMLFTAHKSESQQNGMYTFYKKIEFAVMNTEFDLVASGAFDTGHYVPSKIEYIGKFEDSYKFAITTPTHNYFVSRGAKNETLKFPDTEDQMKAFRVPTSNVLENNYVIDLKNRKIHALYEYYTRNGLGYLLSLKF